MVIYPKYDKHNVIQFGLICNLFLIGYEFYSTWYLGSNQFVVLYAIALISLMSIAFPRVLFVLIYFPVHLIAGLIGKLNTILILSFLYFLLFTPYGIIYNLLKKKDSPKSYWKEGINQFQRNLKRQF